MACVTRSKLHSDDAQSRPCWKSRERGLRGPNYFAAERPCVSVVWPRLLAAAYEVASRFGRGFWEDLGSDKPTASAEGGWPSADSPSPQPSSILPTPSNITSWGLNIIDHGDPTGVRLVCLVAYIARQVSNTRRN